MTLKKLFSCIGLGLFAVASVSAGAIAFAKGPRAEKAVAEGEDDTMCTVIIDMGEATGYDGFHSPEVHYLDETTSTIDKYQMLHQLTGNYYTGTLTYRSADQVIDSIEFLFKQGEDKFSTRLSITPVPSNVAVFAFNPEWTPDPGDGGRYEWTLTKTSDFSAPRFQYYGSGVNNFTKTFTADVQTRCYKATFEIVPDGFDPDNLGQIYFGAWGLGVLRQASIDAYTESFSLNSFGFAFSGKFDLIIYDDYADGGVMSLKLYSETREYIYLVGYDITEDTAIYTFGEGGVEEFGAFPGKRLKNVAGAEEIHGDLKFQGEEYNIWRVELDMNYPKADHLILAQINEYDVVGTQTANMALVRHSAYWFSNEAEYHNDLAGASLDFLFHAEEVRKAATDQSTCEVSKEQATSIVNDYMSLGGFMQETYIDCTKVNTWVDDTYTDKKDYSYREVIEELARIAEIDLSGSKYMNTKTQINNTALVITVASISAMAIAACVAFVVIRKKRHE